jgi:hypothetical protein
MSIFQILKVFQFHKLKRTLNLCKNKKSLLKKFQLKKLQLKKLQLKKLHLKKPTLHQQLISPPSNTMLALT